MVATTEQIKAMKGFFTGHRPEKEFVSNKVIKFNDLPHLYQERIK
jgi:hypothetical protein